MNKNLEDESFNKDNQIESLIGEINYLKSSQQVKTNYPYDNKNNKKLESIPANDLISPKHNKFINQIITSPPQIYDNRASPNNLYKINSLSKNESNHNTTYI